MAQLLMGTVKGENIYINEENFGNWAKKRMGAYFKTDKQITRSKIRGILDLVNKIYNDIFYHPDELTEYQLSNIAYLEVKLAYECGKADDVRRFIEDTRVMAIIGQIKTKEEFLLYARYVESLIAYFKFYGGND